MVLHETRDWVGTQSKQTDTQIILSVSLSLRVAVRVCPAAYMSVFASASILVSVSLCLYRCLRPSVSQ